ncbi:MAG: outer membrane protein transport protein [Thiofilum sp.]|nr:outer membrane protein transport protein [Thiofilum sp.]
MLNARLVSLSLLISTTCFSSIAFATNGLAPTGLGMAHRSMGGAAVANPINTTSMATNPAAASFIPDGYDVGLEVFKPKRSVVDRTTNTEYSGNKKSTFYVPEGGYKRSLSKGMAAGIVIYGNGGMNTGYANLNSPPFMSSDVGVDYQQLFVSPTISFKMGETQAVGLSLNGVYQKFKAEGLSSFTAPGFSVDSNSVTNNGYDSSTGVGGTIGWQGQLSPRVSAGISYRSKVKMGKLDKYKGLLANGGEFDVPAATTVGLSFKATRKTTVAMDIQHIEYNKLASVGNTSTSFGSAQLGSNGGPGFGWQNQTIYKLGVKHQMTPTTALMAGYNYGKSPVKSTETTFNVLAPATSERHLSLGAEFKLSPKSDLTVSYVHAFEKEIQGAGVSPVGLDMYNLKMDQNILGFAYSRRF